MITGWTLFFVVVGVTWTVRQFMRLVEWIDKPRARR